jgi:ubiquinone/menaquinone biosynthesis C-methylase UbiE
MDGHRVISLDLSAQFLSLLVGTSFRIGLQNRIQPVQGEGACLPFLSEFFDVVIASHIIEHLPDPVAFLEELSRILKSGGLLLLSMPSGFEEARLSKHFGLDLDPSDHVASGYSHEDIKRMLPSALNLHEFEYSGGVFGAAIHDAQAILARVLNIRANPRNREQELANRTASDNQPVRNWFLWITREGAVNVLLWIVRIENYLFRRKGVLLDCVVQKI